MNDPKPIDRRTFLAYTVATAGAFSLPAYGAASYRSPKDTWTRIQVIVRNWTGLGAALQTAIREIGSWRPTTVAAMGTWPDGSSAPSGFHLSFRDERDREVVITNAVGLPVGIAVCREAGCAEFVPLEFAQPARERNTQHIETWTAAALTALKTGRAQAIA